MIICFVNKYQDVHFLATATAILNTLHAGHFFVHFIVTDFYSKLSFSKQVFHDIIQVPNSLVQNRPDNSSGLIWVETVCNGYLEMTKRVTSR